jgi:hypothetical protein
MYQGCLNLFGSVFKTANVVILRNVQWLVLSNSITFAASYEVFRKNIW